VARVSGQQYSSMTLTGMHSPMQLMQGHVTKYCITGIFWGVKFVSSEFLACSWKTIRGRGVLNHAPVLCSTVSWVKNFVVRVSTTKTLPPKKYPLYGMCVHAQMHGGSH